MIGILAAALMLQASPAPQRGADVPASQRGADVVVTARPMPSVVVVRQRVQRITRRSGDQVARFDQPVCAGTIGLPQPYGGLVAARIMADAQAAGVRVDGPGCRPNVTLVVVDDGRQLLTEMRRRNPALFNLMPARETERAMAETGPVRAITITQLKSRDGNVLSNDYTRGNTSTLAGGAPTLVVDQASIISLTTRQDITGSLVIVDTAATLGKTLNQLADYTAMRALAKTNAVASATDDSILALFADPKSAPRALTDFDRAFLKALYHSRPTAPFTMQVAQIARDISAQH